MAFVQRLQNLRKQLRRKIVWSSKLRLVSLSLVLLSIMLPMVLSCTEAKPTITSTAPATSAVPSAAPAPTTSVTQVPSKDVYTLTFAWSNEYGPVPRIGQVFRPGGEFQRMLYERSNGRLQLNIVSRMFPTDDIFGAVAQGKADMGAYSLYRITSTYPLWSWATVPGVTREDDIVEQINEQSAICADPRMRKFYDDTFREAGLVHLGELAWSGPKAIWTRSSKISSLADIQGKKIRVFGLLNQMGLSALGAKPVSLPTSEISQSLLSGVIDGMMLSYSFTIQLGLTDIAKYATPIPFGTGWTESILINAKKCDSLPPDLQQVLKDVGHQMEPIIGMANVAESIMTVEIMKNAGVKVTPLPPDDWKKATNLVTQNLESEWLKAAGPRGSEVLSIARDVVAKHRAFNAFPKK